VVTLHRQVRPDLSIKTFYPGIVRI